MMKNLGALTKIWPRTVALLTALVIVLIAWALATLLLTLMEILAPSLLLLFSLASITTVPSATPLTTPFSTVALVASEEVHS